MIICTKKKIFQKLIAQRKLQKCIIGFVPTMGALHNGHLSLIEKSKSVNDITVCSIFVNPTQFNDPKDFEKYPKTIEQDILKLENSKCDILFLPSVEEMYLHDEQPAHYDLGYLETILEGKYRPRHFQGVCQIVDKLLQLVNPDQLFLGQKDYQQCMVIKKMMADRFSECELVICPTQRESSGLAMSSRNMRLNENAQKTALSIFKSLQKIKVDFSSVPFHQIIKNTEQNLSEAGFEKVDYVSISNAENLQEEQEYQSDKKYVALIAAFIGGVRLIDNMVLN